MINGGVVTTMMNGKRLINSRARCATWSAAAATGQSTKPLCSNDDTHDRR